MIEFDGSIQLIPHDRAPLVRLVDNEQLFREAEKLMASEPSHWTDEDVELIRQVGFANLYFYLKHIAGYSGPYSALKPDLHMEMCNWRQQGLELGSWNAGFVPRASYKSSVWTHGPIGWELIREPDLRVGIFSCILDRSLEFMHTVQRTFDSNDLVEVLYPESCVKSKGRDGRWNDLVAIMPNRSRNYPEPSLKAHTAGGSTQGIHVDLAVFDDVVGDAQLNATRSATADMERISNWFHSSLRTLLISQRDSRVTLAATRYHIDDPYERVMGDAKTHDGDWRDLEVYYPKPSLRGRWRVYYRSAMVDGESIFPESYSVEFLQRLAKDDPWTYITQYMNNPHASGSLDFSGYDLRTAEMEFEEGGAFVTLHKPDGKVDRYNVDDCDLVVGVDPAASEKRMTAKTSRTAVAVVARTPCDNVVIMDTRRDYVKPSKMMDWLFRLNSKYRGRIRQFRVEGQGPFKIIKDGIEEEMKRRGEYFYLMMVPAMGEKIASIKMGLEPFLKREALYVVEESMANVRLEYDIFPSSALDLLDAIKIGMAGTHLPAGAWTDGDDEDEDGHNRDSWSHRHTNVTGY